MSPPLSTDLRLRMVKWRIEEKWSYRRIAEIAGCSISTVHNVMDLHATHGTVNNPLAHRTGRPRTLHTDDLNFIENALRENPSLYLEELRERLRTARDVDVSISTLSRSLSRMGRTRSKDVRGCTISKKPEGLNSVEHPEIREYEEPDVFLFLGESAASNIVTQRTGSLSRIGQICIHPAITMGVPYSILPALSLDGIMALDIFEGLITKHRFLKFLKEHIVPIINPYPGKRSIVVMEDCSMHRSAEVRRLVEDDCEARLIYLSPNSQDKNPMGAVFKTIESGLNHNEEQFVSSECVPHMIREAACSITTEDAVEWFKEYGYME